MALEFFLAKNSSPSAKANGIALHSAYNPEIEAERFVQGLDAPFNPSCVIILEGALSYCVPFLRKRFPGAKIGALRFCADFAESDKEWDFALNAAANENCSQGQDAGDKKFSQDQEGSANFNRAQDQEGAACPAPLCDRLFDALGEEALLATLFYEWPPAARAWPQETKNAWNAIKAAVQKARTVLATREHFGKRWLKNKLRFFERVQSAAVFSKIKRPVVICASGPSLETTLDSIKKTRDKIFLCALSSSLGVLARHKIAPDLCLSCDGGYWAKKHLEILQAEFAQSPLALATEAALPAALFKAKTIVPLCYDDDALSQELFRALGLPFMAARRNGTVSGTALELFLEAADGPIFFAGLDLQASKKNSHARPNALQSLSEAKDFRLSPKATRAARATLKNEALDIYADWFSGASLRGKNVYRIKGSEPFGRRLGQIQDISAEEFERAANQNSLQGQNAVAAFSVQKIEGGDRLKTIRSVFEKWSATEAFMAEHFPADSIMARREKDPDQKERRLLALKEKCGRLYKELFKDREAAL